MSHTAREKRARIWTSKLPHCSVDGYCAKTRIVYEFLGCHYHGCKCQPFRDVKTLTSVKTLAERYEQTLTRIEQLKRAAYNVKVKWECDLLTHPVVRHEPMNTREALYGGRTEAMRLYCKIR